MATETATESNVSFEEFFDEWCQGIDGPEVSSLEKGQRFAHKLISQWLEVSESDPDLIICDGSGDGGIDIAYLREQSVDEEVEDAASTEREGAVKEADKGGDTWYLVQSKYGTSFRGEGSIIEEGWKVIRSLAGQNNRLSDSAKSLLARVNEFKQIASARDRIVLVFATDRPISEADRGALDSVRSLGIEQIGGLFDVEDISVATIWERGDGVEQPRISLPIRGNFVDPSDGLRVGTISLIDLYSFLKTYRNKTGDLDQLYEKNVRRFLGGRRKVNKAIAGTLRDEPQLFGLYNNGITIVVSDFDTNSDNKTCTLHDPYVVNGCQTTKTIWEVLQQKIDSGGTGKNEGENGWQDLAENGVVVAKIVTNQSASIVDITRYTNSQNAVREQDFLALREDFGRWAEGMAERYDIFLEIQRGGWESQRAKQKQYPHEKGFTENANAFELIKVYSSGWLLEPGQAFGRNAPFLPGGSVFKQLTEIDRIDVDDLYVAYKLQKLADPIQFRQGKDGVGESTVDKVSVLFRRDRFAPICPHPGKT